MDKWLLLNPKPSDFRKPGTLRLKTDKERFQAIKRGIPGTAMVPIPISDEEILDVLAYLSTIRSYRPDSPVTPSPRPGISPGREQEAGESQQKSSGTGFVVSRQGHVLTNHHVIDGCRAVRATTDGRTQPLMVVGTDPGNDLAVLKLPASAPSMARFRDGRNIRAGDGVVVVGFPFAGLLASDANVTTGTVSALAGIGNDTRFLQITAPVQPGNSGGPLLDQSGHVVGVVVSKLNALKIAQVTGDIPQNVNFAINAAVARSFLDATSVEYESAPSGNRLESSEVGAQAKTFTLLLECFK